MSQISAKAVKELRDKTGTGMMDCKRALGDADGDVAKATELLRERGLSKAGKRTGRATREGVVSIALDGTTAAMVELDCETDFVARTELFVGLGDALAKVVVGDASLSTVDVLLEASLDGETVRDRVTALISQLGENVVVRRVARLTVNGSGVTGGYVHAGGKLGVIVVLATDGASPELEALAKDLAMHVAAADPSPIAVDRSGIDSALLDSERSIFRNQAIQNGKPEKIVDKIVEGQIGKYLSEICLVEQAFVKDPNRTVGDLLSEMSSSSGSKVTVNGYKRFRLGEGDMDQA